MENYKPIIGYEGLYEISDLGNVRSLDRTIVTKDGVTKTYKGKALRTKPLPYCRVGLSKENVCKTYSIHTLVLLAFVGPAPADKPYGRHLDDDPSNNRLDNLVWGTPQENSDDAVVSGAHGKKLTPEIVKFIRHLSDRGLSQSFIGELYSIQGSSVSHILTGRTWSAVSV